MINIPSPSSVSIMRNRVVLMMSRGLENHRTSSNAIRTLSTRGPNRFAKQPQQEPQQQPPSSSSIPYQQQQKAVPHVRLRTKAISMLHANYKDINDEGSGFGGYFNGAGGDMNYEDIELDEDGDAVEESPEDKEKSILADILIQEQQEQDKKKERWMELSKPIIRTSQIDERGRAYGRGGRKTASARVWIQPGLGEMVVNRLNMEDYFPNVGNREHILEPFIVTKTCGKFDVMAWVEGGGTTGQSGAIRHGIARALNHYNPDLYRAALKHFGLLTRDARKVERKKIGLLKARKAPAWVRR